MLSKAEVSCVVIFLTIVCQVFAFEFLPSDEDGVVFGDASGGVQNILVNESNDPGTVNVVIIDKAEAEPSFNDYAAGDKLGVTIIVNDTPEQYHMVVNLLDYDTLGDRKEFPVQVTVNGASKLLSINIQNLDDEPPTLTATTCTMKENTTITVDNSACKFTIEDPDGWLSGMDFSNIEPNGRDEDKLFEFAYKAPPGDGDSSSDVYLILQDDKVLDYETLTLYTFHVHPKDAAGHSATPSESVQIIVQVEDIPDRPPIWAAFTSSKRITEKTPETFVITANDGDYGINNEINYRIDDDVGDLVAIDAKTGKISITGINRDGPNGIDSLTLDVTAFEVGDPDKIGDNYELSDSITLMIEDLDDNKPEISIEDPSATILEIEIDENSDEIDVVLIANDIDLGDNAMYSVSLIKDDSPNSEEFIKAFSVVPSRGYEQTNLTLNVKTPKSLDYENEIWRNISFNVYTEGTKNKDNNCVFPVKIYLKDLNDEAPDFKNAPNNISIYENVTAGTPIMFIQATDADYADRDGVKHELIGAMANGILEIEPLGGNVKTKVDHAFDYEKQNEITIQVRATDNNNNYNTAEVLINVLDLNDEPPTLTAGERIEIPENQKNGYILDTNIKAVDEDKSANLKFSIDWKLSSATKNSATVKPDVFEDKIKDCITVETITDGSNQEATAQLSIKEIVPNNTPDYEVFDTLLLVLVVEDTETDINERTDSATIYISIKNINDNKPYFANETLADKTVIERAENNTIIGVVTAKDDDNLGSLVYSIQSADEDTPAWIGIENGNLFVSLQADEEIDCDYPDNAREFLTYIVSVHDGDPDHTITHPIKIKITDINDKAPEVLQNITITINEDNEITHETLDNTTIYDIITKDDDRDEAFHTVKCTLQSSTDSDVSERFKVVNNQIVVDLQGSASLNREDKSSFKFQLQCYDDPNHVGTVPNYVSPPPDVTIILLDVNDKIPKIIPPTEDLTLSENSAINTENKIQGEDGDTEERGEIDFKLVKIHRTYGKTEEDLDLNLFSLQTDETKKSATLTLAGNLTNCYGELELTVNTTDNGTPPLSSENKIKINVEKWNFKEPEFKFPQDNAIYYLNPSQDPDSKLRMWNGESNLPDLEAWDQQANKFKIDFKIASDSSAEKIFTIANQGKTQSGNYKAELRVKTSNFKPVGDIIEVIINAKADTGHDSPVGNEAPYEKNCTMRLLFFDKDSDPVFDESYRADTFEPEEEKGDAHYDLKYNATYPDVFNLTLPIYYYLGSGDEELFEVVKEVGTLKLKKALDYEKGSKYTVVIQASSRNDGPNKNAADASKLTLTINVKDINDNPPVFEKSQYFETMVYNNQKNVITTVTAIDADAVSKDQLTYSIAKTSASPESLLDVGSFKIDPKIGSITAGFELTQDLKGYFILTVQVQDQPPEKHTNSTEVWIYIVGKDHLVEFKFNNPLTSVQNLTNAGKIKEILDEEFNFQSNIEDLTDNSSKNITTVPVYFLDTEKHEPVEGNIILSKVTNVETFNDLSGKFTAIGLSLMNFQTDDASNENIEEILKGALIGVSVVLGSLCLALLVAFLLKTRALNQRIKNLSNTKFGSQESGLNRQGVNAPTTNKHAIEGSNPVYNNEVDTEETNNYDPARFSVTSGDSDLIGVEDDDKFNYNYPTKDEEIIQ